MKKIVILSNHHTYTYNFRKEIIQKLLTEKYKVYIVLPYGEKVDLLKEMGCEFIDLPLDRRGMNIFADFKLLLDYNRIIKRIKPDVVLSYTIKPNIYGGMVCRKNKIPFIPNVTGLGSGFEKKGLVSKALILLYRIALKNSSCTFFQNASNRDFFVDNKIGSNINKIIPGSGVNLIINSYEDYPKSDKSVRFLFIGRIMKEKGIENLIDAAIGIKKEFNNVEFDAIGFYENDYAKKALELSELGIISFHGVTDNVRDYIRKSHAVVLPSYHEGMANVLLEAASTGRPVIASNIPGCKETFNENVSGFSFKVKDSADLKNTLVKFINLPYLKKRNMGIEGRRKMEKEFDRELVINAYINEIQRIVNKEN